MGQISVNIQNRTYRLSCDDGEEGRLAELAAHVRAKADGLIAEHGRIGDEHLMLMSAILVADELWDLRGVTATQAPATKTRAKKPAETQAAAGAAADEPSADTVAKQKSAAVSG